MYLDFFLPLSLTIAVDEMNEAATVLYAELPFDVESSIICGNT
jgi:hypothetical protein